MRRIVCAGVFASAVVLEASAGLAPFCTGRGDDHSTRFTGALESPRVLLDHGLPPGATVSSDAALVCAAGYVRKYASSQPFYRCAQGPQQLTAGYPGTEGLSARHIAVDHLVLSGLGGDLRNPKHLWPEPGQYARPMDTLPTPSTCWDCLYRQVCQRHTLTVGRKRAGLVAEWR